MSQIKAGIINVTGYIGAELARLLYQHPQVKLQSVTGRSLAGQRLGEVFPNLDRIGLIIEAEIDKDIDIAFVAMPHKASVNIVPDLLEMGIQVIDLGADFRLKDAGAYPRWYGFEHPAPELLGNSVYGLPELHRSDIVSASLVANPGCYSTSAILALAPAVQAGIINQNIIIDSKSGVSGAGRTLSLTTHYSEVNESLSAYSLGGHRHQPEIKQELDLLSTDFPLAITFVPHLVPMTRGILSSCYAKLKDEKQLQNNGAIDKIKQLYVEYYKSAPFIQITSKPPETKHALGSNFCLIYITVDIINSMLIVISCIDNLVKGGAGQAIQNMNLMFNLPETTGLETLAIYP
jgi:N-acetyl-gamma-glutamyl-phosphate reductase